MNIKLKEIVGFSRFYVAVGIVVCAMLSLTPNSSEATMVSLSPATQDVLVGEQAVVDLFGSAWLDVPLYDDVYAYEVDIYYDSNLLTLDDWILMDPFASFFGEEAGGLGHLSIFGEFLDPFLDGSHIGSLVFTALDVGAVMLSNQAGTGGGPSPSVTVNISPSSAPIPEPSTMLLLGSGLLGMVFWRRKQGLKQG